MILYYHPGGSSLPMLDGEVRLLLDLMEQAEKDGRPKLHTLPYAEGRAAVDKMSEDSEASSRPTLTRPRSTARST